MAYVIDMALAYVGEIAEAQGEASKWEVYGELVAEAGGVEGSCKADVMISVAECEELIIALSVGGGEHRAEERNVHLVAENERLAPKSEGIDGCSRDGKMQLGCGLCRVVAVAGVIECR